MKVHAWTSKQPGGQVIVRIARPGASRHRLACTMCAVDIVHVRGILSTRNMEHHIRRLEYPSSLVRYKQAVFWTARVCVASSGRVCVPSAACDVMPFAACLLQRVVFGCAFGDYAYVSFSPPPLSGGVSSVSSRRWFYAPLATTTSTAAAPTPYQPTSLTARALPFRHSCTLDDSSS